MRGCWAVMPAIMIKYFPSAVTKYQLTRLGLRLGLRLGAAFCGVWVWAAQNIEAGRAGPPPVRPAGAQDLTGRHAA